MVRKKARVSDETFDDLLAEQGMLGVCEERAIKEIIAEQLAEAMKEQGITKSAMAERMKTSRRQLDRLSAKSMQAFVGTELEFIVFKDTYELWYVKPFARVLGVIPISSEQKPRSRSRSNSAFARSKVTAARNVRPPWP